MYIVYKYSIFTFYLNEKYEASSILHPLKGGKWKVLQRKSKSYQSFDTFNFQGQNYIFDILHILRLVFTYM